MANAYIDKIAIAADTYDVNAIKTNGVFYGTVDSTSTATVFTASIEGLTELKSGTVVILHNGVVTSASGFTININNLGAKKCYNNMTDATRDTTIFNIAYTMMFIYSEDLDGGNGGWWCYRGYDANTNTIGYQLRTNSGNLVASDTGYKYRLWLTSADGSKWVPINTSTSTNATENRTLNTRPIDPFGPIVYRATNGTCTAGTGIGATGIWQQYTCNIGYSYMATGFALTFPDSVFLRCTPQADGSAVMNDIVQALPTSKDGKIYIHLGTAYNATNMELQIEHPVYWHDGTGIRLWTGAEPSAGGSTVEVTQTLTSGTGIASININGTSTTLYAPTPSTVPGASSTTPAMDGTAAAGTSADYARADHVHPTDTTRADASAIENATFSSGIISTWITPRATLLATLNSLNSGKQAKLVSGTNIKTVGSQSLLGSGNLTASDIGAAESNHAHGNITSGGDITATATIASGDRIVINDESASKITNSSITFGTGTTTFLANNGTWQTPVGTYTLPTATTSSLGGIQVGTGLTAANNGTLSINTDNSITTTSSTNYPTTSAVVSYVEAKEEILISSTQPTAADNYKIWIEI